MTTQTEHSSQPPSAPWYKHPLVWLVISGPAIVVLAAFYSAYIAYSGADLLVQDQREATRAHALEDVSADAATHPGLIPADKVRKMGANAEAVHSADPADAQTPK